MKEDDESRIEPPAREAVEMLRAQHAVPGGEDYWDTLHANIMARIAGSGVDGHAWWMVLSRWAKPALAAAAVAMIVATAAIIALSSPRTAIAYDDLLEAQAQVPVQTARAAPSGSAREATFQFVMSSNGGRIP